MKLPAKHWKFDGDEDFTQIVRAAATLINAWRTSSDDRVLGAMASATRVLERELDDAAASVSIERRAPLGFGCGVESDAVFDAVLAPDGDGSAFELSKPVLPDCVSPPLAHDCPRMCASTTEASTR